MGRAPLAPPRHALSVSYLLLADSHKFVCRTWDDLAAGLVWALEEGM